MVDAYYSDSIPFHLTTVEFLDLVRSRLTPGGVVVSNMIGSIRGPASQLFRSFYRTYRSVFPTVLVHPVVLQGEPKDDALRNLMLVATDGAAPTKDFLVQRWREIRRAVDDRSRPDAGDPRPPRLLDPDRRRPHADGRLRADRRATAGPVARPGVTALREAADLGEAHVRRR